MLTSIRFGGGLVVVNAGSKVKGRGRELQLPSIQQLTSKSSSQQFLLRILKVIIQLRQAAKSAAKKAAAASGESSVVSCLPFCAFYILVHI